jgi:hypothetical protein
MCCFVLEVNLSSLPIVTPANFAAASAMGYSDPTGGLSLVSANSPLPVSMTGAATPAPLVGTASAGGTYGPFAPARGVPVVLVLSGTWQGSVQVMRSTNGGANLIPLTVGGAPWAQFTGNACEPVWEDNDPAATLHLVVALTSGALTYRLGH